MQADIKKKLLDELREYMTGLDMQDLKAKYAPAPPLPEPEAGDMPEPEPEPEEELDPELLAKALEALGQPKQG